MGHGQHNNPKTWGWEKRVKLRNDKYARELNEERIGKYKQRIVPDKKKFSARNLPIILEEEDE